MSDLKARYSRCEILRAPTYPGSPHTVGRQGGLVGPITDHDLEGHIFQLDFHFPLGAKPISISLVEDIVAGSRPATQTNTTESVSQTHGLMARLIGPHVYLGTETRAEAVVGSRGDDFDAAGFAQAWEKDALSLDLEFNELMRDNLADYDPHAFVRALASARRHHQRAWQIHFRWMYPLIHIFKQASKFAADQGQPQAELLRDLGFRPSSASSFDGAVVRLAELATAQGVDIAAIKDAELTSASNGPIGPTSAWIHHYLKFLQQYGQRTSLMADPSDPSWLEEPKIGLSILASLQSQSRRPAIAPENMVIHRAQAPKGQRGKEPAWIQRMKMANFVWWNEEHNATIDLRAHIPLRKTILEIARSSRWPSGLDPFFLFYSEIEKIAGGEASPRAYLEVTNARSQYFHLWKTQRHLLPEVLGDEIGGSDDVMNEVLGTTHLRRSINISSPNAGHDSPIETLFGLGVSSGKVTGRARRIDSPLEIGLLCRGDILVTQATTPSWNLAFSVISGCVTDYGGILTHCAIVAREVGIPCVCATTDSTSIIQDGAMIEVDADLGVVHILAPPVT